MNWKSTYLLSLPSLLFLALLHFSGCSSAPVKPTNISNELPVDLPKDMQEKFEVKEIQSKTHTPASLPIVEAEFKPEKKSRKKSKSKAKAADPVPVVQSPFVYPTRRPEKDPIWVGEHLTFGIYYFGVSAGDFTLEILPFKMLGTRKVYHIQGHAVTSAVFSLFYRVNDVVESYMDYDASFSHRFHLVLDETKQKRDSLELNDSEKQQTFYWNRWHPKDAEFRETKETGPIQAYSQDSLSALYYLRTVPLPTGAVVSFPVVSEGKTWEAICTVVRRETLDTPIGRVKTLVIQPDTKYQGVLKKNGDSFLWLTDDDRRIPVRLEAKVKIGTVVATLKKMSLGHPTDSQSEGPKLASQPTPEPSKQQ